MKAKFVFPTDRGPETDAEWKVYEEARLAHKPNPLPPWKVGDINDRPDCFWLVRFGVCTPEDDECRQACGLTDEQIAERIEMQRKMQQMQLTGNPALDADDPDEVDDE